MNRDALLELEHVSYSYDGEAEALKDVSVAIHPGERIAVLGNNGAGKSTFFLLCNGVLKPGQGAIRYHGKEISRQKSDLIRLRKGIGVVFQDAETQIIASTVEGEVSFGPMNLGLSRLEVSGRVDDALSRMNLLDYRDRAPQYLSGGEKKRVSIADILAMQPDAILFDEPTASLDPENVRLLEKTLAQLSGQGITILLSTHDVDFAYRFAQRALVFHQGRLIADGEIGGVFGDDEIIRKAGLRKPALYDVTECLARVCGLETGRTEIPRTLDAFERLIVHARLNR